MLTLWVDIILWNHIFLMASLCQPWSYNEIVGGFGLVSPPATSTNTTTATLATHWHKHTRTHDLLLLFSSAAGGADAVASVSIFFSLSFVFYFISSSFFIFVVFGIVASFIDALTEWQINLRDIYLKFNFLNCNFIINLATVTVLT